jgi:3-oxosteroid 1-dehydrogenase
MQSYLCRWRGPWFALSERNSPGAIIMNMAGMRFMYGGDYGQGSGPRREHPGVAGVRPAVPRPLHLRGTATGTTHSEDVAGVRVIVKADTLEELAAKAGLPVDVSRRQ